MSHPNTFEALLTDLTHMRSCPSLTPGNEEDCTCGLVWRKRLRTEMEMHNAWRKRAEEAESALAPHYIHKDKVRELRDWCRSEAPHGAIGPYSQAIVDLEAKLTALLGKEGE